MKKSDIKKIIKDNIDIDKSEFEKVQKQLEKLRELGIREAEYDLASPFVRRLREPIKEEEKESASFYIRT